MTLKRRQLLAGLGLLGASGFAVGSLAFTAVDADRDVTVQFEDDADAILGMVGARDPQYLTIEDDGVSGIAITIEQVNRNAWTRFDDLVEFTNNGVNEITELSFEVIEDNSENAALEIPAGTESIGPIASGNSIVGLSLAIESREVEGFTGDPSIDATIMISAETDA